MNTETNTMSIHDVPKRIEALEAKNSALAAVVALLMKHAPADIRAELEALNVG